MIVQIKDGKFKLMNEYPKTYKVDGRDISPFHLQDVEVLKTYGFYPEERPVLLPTEKLGAIYLDEARGVVTYPKIPKTAQELEQETANAKEVKRQEVKQKYLDIMAEDKIALNPTDALLYFPEWKAGSYKIDARVTYKGKPFKNTAEGNTNAPDKGGWTEIK